jgi:ATP-dependent DNA ligase
VEPGRTSFYAFDLMWLNGMDIRKKPLIERKERLSELVPRENLHLLYVGYIENGDLNGGTRFFDMVCSLDLEGIVCKPRNSPYADNWWIKVKNEQYSQNEGRRELFNRFRTAARVL